MRAKQFDNNNLAPKFPFSVDLSAEVEFQFVYKDDHLWRVRVYAIGRRQRFDGMESLGSVAAWPVISCR
jgi:hypothetical protein